MVVKRSMPLGVCLGALLLLVGTAQAAETGYWKQQGEVVYLEKQVPPIGPNPYVHPGGYARTKYEIGIGKVRFTTTNGSGWLIVNEVTWTLPTVLIPHHVVPVSCRFQVLKSNPEGKGSGNMVCYQGPLPAAGGILDLFKGMDVNFGGGKTGYSRDRTNTKNSVGGGGKGAKLYLTLSVTAGGILNVATPYVWVEGVPPAQPPAAALPPMVAVADGQVPPFTPTAPVTPTPPVRTAPGPTAPGAATDIAGTWRHGAGGETWTFTPLGGGRYAAVEKGFGNARGTAAVSGNKVTIDYTTQGGQKTGKCELTVAADGRTATSTWTENTGQSGTRDWVRVDGPSSIRMTLLAETRKAKTGETVTVPVWLLKGAGLIDMNFNLEYDASVVQAVGSVVKGNLLEGADFEANPGRPGVVQVGFVPKTGGVAASDGTVAQIAFRAVGQPGSRTPLRLVPRKASLAGGAPASPATIDGEIQIVDDAGLAPCDISGDGKVGMDDVLLALKISVGLLPQNARADVDKDGQVTAADARMIRNRVLGIKE